MRLKLDSNFCDLLTAFPIRSLEGIMKAFPKSHEGEQG